MFCKYTGLYRCQVPKISIGYQKNGWIELLLLIAGERQGSVNLRAKFAGKTGQQTTTKPTAAGNI